MILDTTGAPIEIPRTCPSCRAPEKKFETYKMHGEYWKTLCTNCGHILASGQGDVPEGAK